MFKIRVCVWLIFRKYIHLTFGITHVVRKEIVESDFQQEPSEGRALVVEI